MNYQCDSCGYNTHRKFCFDRHLLSTRHIDNVKEITQIASDIKKKKSFTEITKLKNKYNCNHCNKLFDSIEDIERHVKLECRFDIRYDNFYKFMDEKLGINMFPDNQNAGDIYILQTDFSQNNIYKIGITTNLQNRLAQYRTGCNFEPRLHYYFPCKDINLADNLLKKKLFGFNIKREIYKGDIEVIKKVILKNLKEINDKQVFAYKPGIVIKDICECLQCNKVFFMNCDLMEHNKEMHPELFILANVSTFKCNYCQSFYTTSSNLAKHKRICREKTEFEDKYVDENNKLKQEIISLKNELDNYKKDLEYHKQIISKLSK